MSATTREMTLDEWVTEKLGPHHFASRELATLRAQLATVQAERDITRAALEKVSELFDDKVRDLANTMHELATLRETLVGEVEAAKRTINPDLLAKAKAQGYGEEMWPETHAHNAALDRAITIIKGTP